MAEWNENKLEQELETLMEDIPVQEDLEKKIAQSITRRIKRTAGITVIAILLAAAVLFLCISPLMDMMFWDPATSVEGDQSLVFSVLRDYWEVNAPYVDLVRLQVEKQGFGCYELAMQVTDHQGSLQIGRGNLWMELNRGKYENIRDAEGYFVHKMGGRFEANMDAGRKTEMVQSLLELPVSAIVYLSVSEAQPRDVADLREETVDLHWLQVYQPNVEFHGGLSMLVTSAYTKNDMRQTLSEAELLQVYCANLKNLLDHPKVWAQFNLCNGNMIYTAKSGVLEKTYKDALTLETLTTKNYCISGTRDEIIEYLQRTEVTSVWVDEVRMSKWN